MNTPLVATERVHCRGLVCVCLGLVVSGVTLSEACVSWTFPRLSAPATLRVYSHLSIPIVQGEG